MQDDIEIEYSTAQDSEIVKINISSLQNNFLNHYINQICDNTISFPINLGQGKQYIEPFFRQLFFNNISGFTVKNNTGLNWLINYQPYFHKNNSEDYYWFITNGYRKLVSGFEEVSKADLFLKSCNALGLNFKINNNYINNTYITTELRINNRTNLNSVKQLDFENIIKTKITNRFDRTSVEYIAISDGIITAGAGYYGANAIPLKLISTKEVYSNYGRFFYGAMDFTSYYVLYPYPYPEYYLVKDSKSNDNDYLVFGKVRYTNSNQWNSRYTEEIKIKSKNILFIDAGENVKGTRINMADKVIQMDSDGLESGAGSKNQVYYKGNYGNMYVVLDSNLQLVYDYDSYSRTDTFLNNFKPILQNMISVTVDIEYNGVFHDYISSDYNVINFTNTTDSFYLGNWNILDVEIDLKNEISKLKIKKNI